MTACSIPRVRLTDQAAARLVCLPYAGGGSAVFHRWRPLVPASIDLVPLSLPGHDGRLAETPRTDLCALARALADDLATALDRPYVLVGHSLGAWIAFEVARELRRTNRPLPELLVSAAARPPDTALAESPLYRLPDDELIAAVSQRYGGIPPAIVEKAELLELLLPALRADIQMVETYRYAEESPLDVEILALGGTDDPAVSAADLAGWSRHTTRSCSVRQFPGGHFFLFRSQSRHAQSAASDPSTPALQTILHSLRRFLPHNNSKT